MLTQDPLGLAGGVNLYAYAGNDPVNFDDPFGLCPACVGAALGVAEGYAVAKLLGQQYTWKDAATDAALGAAGGGLVSKLQKLGEASQNLGYVYKRIDPKTGERYFGRARDEVTFLRRQGAHDRALGVRHEYEVVARAKPGTPLRVAEESAIRQHGGPGRLANKRYEMNEEAYRAAGGTVAKP